MNANIEVKPHPALVGETTDLYIGILREYRKAREVALRSNSGIWGSNWNSVAYSYWTHKLGDLVGDGYGFGGNADAELAEALEWLRRADAGEPEAKAVIAAIPPHYTEDEHSAEINEHADYLRGLRDIVTGDKPTGAKRKGKGAAAEPEELERITAEGDRLPESWRPKMQPDGVTARLWKALNEMYGESQAPVPECDLKEAAIVDYFPADLKDPDGSYRIAKHRLSAQKAFKETPEGLTPRRVK
jgi:hypothetical protein